MRGIENRESCTKKKKKKKKKKGSINKILTFTLLPTGLDGNKKRSFLQIPQRNQETALKVLQHCRDCFALPGVFCCKAEVIDITMGMLCC
ncbi:hypothetical protein AN641_00415 [Candidatus Epulonipiscioides gigas]|nr:hypothetical protein AN641_00415 [Epulopiscium sp. SCG-C07WGA-EpuloA2]